MVLFHITFDYSFFYGMIKENIRVYKDLKFIMLRLIYDY